MQRPEEQYDASARVRAASLAIALGGFGLHKFYLGYNVEGAIMLGITVVSFGVFIWVPWIVGIAEGFKYLRMTDDEFEQRYLEQRRRWF